MSSNSPFEPIVVNTEGEAVFPSSTGCTDESVLFREHIHVGCEGRMPLVGVSQTHRALFCSHCGLRAVFPKTVETYEELRAYFAAALKKSDNR